MINQPVVVHASGLGTSQLLDVDTDWHAGLGFLALSNLHHG